MAGCCDSARYLMIAGAAAAVVSSFIFVVIELGAPNN